MKADKLEEALRPLLSIALYCSAKNEMGGGDFWISYAHPGKQFVRFFDDYNSAWQEVLERPGSGLSEVCSEHLLTMLEKWESDVNSNIKSVHDESYAEDGLKIRLKLTGGFYSEFEDDEDEDEDDDNEDDEV